MTPVSVPLKFSAAVLAFIAATRVAADVVVDPAIIEAVGSGRARVLIELRLPTRFVPEGELAEAAVQAQREAIAAVQRAIVLGLADHDARVARQYETVPFLALEIGADALAELRAMPALVTRILEDDVAATIHPSQ